MTRPDEAVRIWGVVPAAGMSRRMGRPKQTLPYGDSTLVATVTRTLLNSGVHGGVVVTRTELVAALRLPEDERVTVAVNDDADSEMIDSIRIGLAVLAGQRPTDASRAPEASRGLKPAAQADLSFDMGSLPSDMDGVLIVPADMPALTTGSCRKCIAAFVADPRRIVIAMHAGKRGHPIIFPFALRAAVDTLDGGLRQLAGTYPDRVHLVETLDAGTMYDVDTREDYNQMT